MLAPVAGGGSRKGVSEGPVAYVLACYLVSLET